MGELARRIRAKYPSDYKDWSDDELEQGWLEKYPSSTQYKEWADAPNRIAANNATTSENLKKSESAAKPPRVPTPYQTIANLPQNAVNVAAGIPQGLAKMGVSVAESVAAPARLLMRDQARRHGVQELPPVLQELAKKIEVEDALKEAAASKGKPLSVPGLPTVKVDASSLPAVATRRAASADRGLVEYARNPGLAALQSLEEDIKGYRTAIDTQGPVIAGQGAETAQKIGEMLPIAGAAVAAPIPTGLALLGGEAGRRVGEFAAPTVAEATGEKPEDVSRILGETGANVGMFGAAGLAPKSTHISIPEMFRKTKGAYDSVTGLIEAQKAESGMAAPPVEPGTGNLLPPGGVTVPQNKPVAAQGAMDAALAKLAEEREAMAGELVGSAAAGAVSRAIPIIGNIPGVPWIARRLGAKAGRTLGAAKGAMRRSAEAAEAAAQSKPAASVGAQDSNAVLRERISAATEGPVEIPELAHMIVPEPPAKPYTTPIAPEGAPPSQQWGVANPEAFRPEPPVVPEPPPTVEQRFAQTQTEQAGQVPAPLARFIDKNALEAQFAQEQAGQAGQLPVEIPQRNIPPATLGMIERAFDRNGPSGAIELGKQLGLDEATATGLVNDLAAATDAGERVPTSEPVNQFTEAPPPTPPPAPATAPVEPTAMEALLAEMQRREAESAAAGARPGAADAQQARLDALNSMDQLEQMTRQPAAAPTEPVVTEPKRPAVVEPKIPEEMARQTELAAKAKEKQAAREKEPNYSEKKAAKQQHPAFVETYSKMIADGFDQKTARAAAYKAAEAAEKASANAKASENVETKLKESVAAKTEKPAEKPATAPAPAPAKPPTEAAKSAPAAKEPVTVQELLDSGRADEARSKAISEATNPEESVTVGQYAGKKIGDTLPNGAIITEISNGRIDTTTKPPKGAKPTGEPKGRAYSVKEREATREATKEEWSPERRQAQLDRISGEVKASELSDGYHKVGENRVAVKDGKVVASLTLRQIPGEALPNPHVIRSTGAEAFMDRVWENLRQEEREAGKQTWQYQKQSEASLTPAASKAWERRAGKSAEARAYEESHLHPDDRPPGVGPWEPGKGSAGQATPKAPIAEQYAQVAEQTRKTPPTEGSQFRMPQATKEMGRLMKIAREAEGNPETATHSVPEGKRGENLYNLPATVKVDGKDRTYGAFKPAQDIAKEYVESTGRKYEPTRRYVEVDKDRAKRIADEYEKMKHDPENPQVKAAYKALIDETLAQYQAMLDSGLKVEFVEGGADPYPNPRAAIDDVTNNNHLYIFSTRKGFGPEGSTLDVSNNPLLSDTKYKISGETALANDIFRAVHDYFGHVKEGVGFRASGEENAWRSHASMYSPLARRAMTTETRGQNSWVNFGPFGEKNRTAKAADTVFGEQKVGLLPEWVSDIPKSEYSAKFKGMAHPEAFENIDAWKAHNRALGFSEEQINSALREDTLARSKAFKAPEKVEVPTLAEVRKELPQYFGDRLYQEGNGFVIETPSATIRINKVGEIEADLGALEEGRPGATAAYKRGEVAILGETTHIDGGALIRLVELGEATHEIKHVAWRMLSDKERSAVTKELQPSVDRLNKEGKGTSVEELFADGFNPNAPRPEAKTALGKAYQRIYDFFEGIYRAFVPNLKSVTKSVESGKVFERKPTTGTGAAYAARLKAPVDTVAIRRGSGAARNSKSITEVQKQLKNPDISGLSEEAQISRMADQGVREIEYQRQQIRSGEKWYKLDIDAMEAALKKAMPALKDATQMGIFKLISAVTSFGNKPNPNIEIALQIYKGLQERGELPTMQDTGKHWSGTPTFDVSVEKLNRIAEDHGGLEGMVEWLKQKHTVAELRKYNKHGVPGKAADMVLGAEVLGPKGGAFFQNLIGNYSKTTADMWFSRTFNRWRGTAFKDAPRNTSEFKMMQKVNEEIARRMGIDPADTQAMLWFHEKGLYGKLGAKEDFGSYAVAGRRAAESLKERQRLGISDLTAVSPVKPQERTVAFEVKFGTDSPYSKKYDWKSLTPEQARKVTDEHAQYLIDSVEAETGVRVVRANPSTGVYAEEANPNWVVKMKGTPEQIESATNLFAIGSQQDAVIASRSVAKGGSPGLQVTKSTVKPKPTAGKQLGLFGGETKAQDWSAPGFLEKVWKEYSRLVPEIAKDGGASLEFSEGSTRIQLYGIESDSAAAQAALKKAMATVDPASRASVAQKNFETYWTSNKWGESAKGESYRDALRERGYTDEAIDQFVAGADKSIDNAWHRPLVIEPKRKYSVGGGPGRVRTSTRDALESLESARKPRKPVVGVLEHLVDTKPRIAPPEKPKAPLEGLVKQQE